MDKEAREIRITIDARRIVLAGLLAALLIIGATAASFVLVRVMDDGPAMAQDYTAQGFTAATNAEKAWIFAEGYTGPGFDEWILLYNPSANYGGTGYNAVARLIYSNNNGSIGYDDVYCPVGQRVTMSINQALANKGYSGDVTVVVIAYKGSNPEDRVPIVAERAMYFDYNGITGGSQTLGYPVK